MEIFQGRRNRVIDGVLKEKMGKLAVGVEEEEEEEEGPEAGQAKK